MNKKLSTSCLILITASLFLACQGPVKHENKNVLASPASPGQKYSIDTSESVITWKGSMLMGANSHAGYIYISKGSLMIQDGQLTGGTAEVDMNTIEDEAHGRNNGLVNHLKDPDFFDVKKFPFSTIAITRVASIKGADKEITANLTIKGVTNAVIFPVKVEVKDGLVQANGKLAIDRTLWGVRYKSGKFYANLADQAMSDSIEFHIKIVAKNI